MHGNTHVRDHLPPGNIQLIIVGKLQLVETNANHCTDLHVHGLLLWEGGGGRRGGRREREGWGGDGKGRRMGRRGYMTYSIFAPGSSQQCKFETLL